jgi:mannose-6-phosphate isomerase-like protein (cupin superfamily)
LARAGDILENPATGDRVVFRKTAAETDGEALEYEITFVPRGFAAQEHLHPGQQERHEVLEGELGIVVAGRERRLGPGDVEVVPPRTPHRIFAVRDEPVRALFESRPALRSAELLETLFRLGAKPNPLQLAAIGHDFGAEGYPTRPPRAVQLLLLPPLAALGRGMADEYVFVDEWDVDAPQQAVFDAVSDGRTYTEWWKPVYISVEGDENVTYHHFKGKLPYTLKTRTELVSKDPPTRVEVKVDGDLRGRGVWTLSQRDGKTHVRFDWTVFADKPIVRALTPVLRPLFRWNHAWAIARAREGLEPYARSRAS